MCIRDSTQIDLPSGRTSGLNDALKLSPEATLKRLDVWVSRIDAYGHGSRYYNIKQARNEAVRRLAEAGHHPLALVVLRPSWPPHHQDWACPNRDGTLRALEARSAARGDVDAIRRVNEQAIRLIERFALFARPRAPRR